VVEGYLLKFSDETIRITHHESLSHSSFGYEGSSPGITGRFYDGPDLELWQFDD